VHGQEQQHDFISLSIENYMCPIIF